MDTLNEVSADNFEEVVGHLEEVYGNAQWALRYGATKEDLLGQIEEAFRVHQDCLPKDGWLISANN